MAWLLRKVKWSRWQDRIADPLAAFSLMSPDPIGDLGTSQRKLSLWQLEIGRENLNRVIALLAATLQAPAECAYIILPQEMMTALNFKIEPVPGNSPDAFANQKWHFDVTIENAHRLLEFARALLSSGELARHNPALVKQLLLEGIAKAELDRVKMDKKLCEKLGV